MLRLCKPPGLRNPRAPTSPCPPHPPSHKRPKSNPSPKLKSIKSGAKRTPPVKTPNIEPWGRQLPASAPLAQLATPVGPPHHTWGLPPPQPQVHTRHAPRYCEGSCPRDKAVTEQRSPKPLPAQPAHHAEIRAGLLALHSHPLEHPWGPVLGAPWQAQRCSGSGRSGHNPTTQGKCAPCPQGSNSSNGA